MTIKLHDINHEVHPPDDEAFGWFELVQVLTLNDRSGLQRFVRETLVIIVVGSASPRRTLSHRVFTLKS